MRSDVFRHETPPIVSGSFRGLIGTVPVRFDTSPISGEVRSVADPGSGAFLTPQSGSGIRDPGWVKNQDPDPR